MNKPEFIAEVSSNHNRDIERSKKFIKTASEIGCDGVKFQLFKIEKLFAPEILKRSKEHRNRKNWELPDEFIPELSNFAHKLGIKFSCTPFYLEAVDVLDPYVDFYKIASYELLWTDLLEKVAKTKRLIVLSTGMAIMDEIENAVKVLRNSGCEDLTLLQCVSGYPTPVNEANLSVINTLRKEFNCNVGWSDHSVSPAVIYRAVNRWNASMVEFHLDLEGKGEEFETGHCWLPNDIKNVIGTVNEGFQADGSGEKKPTHSEIGDRDWRADPEDGLRPLKKIREGFGKCKN